MNSNPVNFSPAEQLPFSAELRKRVFDYFKTHGISTTANTSMIVKTFVLLLLYFIPYFFLVLGFIEQAWIVIALYAVMGVGMAGIGMGVMHDANHGSYSKNQTVNKIIGHLIEFVGGSAVTWRLQHNVLHHTYTNVSGKDEDIDPPSFMRFSPNEEWKPVHRFQHWYAWFFYSLMTISWAIDKDFKQMFRYKKHGILKTQKVSFARYMTELTVAKVLYWGYSFVLPLIFVPVAWYWIVISFVMMHLIAGFILGIVFQPAHVVPENEFPMPDEKGILHGDRAVHQLLTTSNFAPKSGWLTWFAGGLNYQVEHHLFPYICHVHYPKISKIVQDTAKEFGVPYHVQPTFWAALRSHAQMLKKLGQPA